MNLLLLGMVLWWGGHLFKRFAPQTRATMGNGGRAFATALILAGLVAMVLGYRGAEYVHFYAPPAWGKHANNLLMLLAVITFGMGMAKGRLWTYLRHPMLTGVLLWGFAHLLVRGDLASVVLFGGLALWSLVEMAAINRAEGRWVRPAPGAARRDLALIGIAAAMYVLIAFVHLWAGYPVFGV